MRKKSSLYLKRRGCGPKRGKITRPTKGLQWRRQLKRIMKWHDSGERGLRGERLQLST